MIDIYKGSKRVECIKRIRKEIDKCSKNYNLVKRMDCMKMLRSKYGRKNV